MFRIHFSTYKISTTTKNARWMLLLVQNWGNMDQLLQQRDLFGNFIYTVTALCNGTPEVWKI